jgi:hypothetical protein
MSERELALIDFEDIQVRGLSGDLKRKWRPKKVELSMTTTIGIDSSANRANVQVEVDMFGQNESDDESDKVLTYSGSVTLHVIAAKGFKFSERKDQDQARRLIELVWPYARTSLVEHAQRLGNTGLRIPLVAMAGDVEPVA